MMIENCTLYFPTADLPLEAIFPDGKYEQGEEGTSFEYESGDGRVRLNLSPADLEEHLRGFKGYVARLPNSNAARARARDLIDGAKSALGVILPGPVAPSSQVFGSLRYLIDCCNGFMFVADSIMLADGTFVVGPMADDEMEDEPAEAPLRDVDPADCKQQGNTEGVDPARLAMRERHYHTLAQRGFMCARWLPLYRTEGEDQLRPVAEIAGRLLALKALFLWVSAPEEMAATERILNFVERNALGDHLTEEENELRLLSREEACEHAGNIGWRLENMWALAWMLGFDPVPPFYRGQLPQEVIRRMVLEFLPKLDGSLEQFAAEAQLRSAAEIAELEDLYYCTHNAVRSAQNGGDTVPDEFHPVRDGGATHERRQALTWALSPGVDWEDTDVST